MMNGQILVRDERWIVRDEMEMRRTEGQRDRGTEGQRDRGTERGGKRRTKRQGGGGAEIRLCELEGSGSNRERGLRGDE
jgi:hypothetical protein